MIVEGTINGQFESNLVSFHLVDVEIFNKSEAFVATMDVRQDYWS